MKNNDAHIKIIIFIAIIATILVGSFAYDCSKTIDFGKVTGQLEFMQLIIILIGFLACLIMTLLYIFYFDSSPDNLLRLVVTVSMICLNTFIMVKFVVPTMLPFFQETIR